MSEIIYSENKDVAISKLLKLYKTSQYNQWWTERHVRAMFNYCYLLITAWADDHLVGTVTVISDGVNFAYIDDLLVHPSFRGRKIGSTLMQKVLDRIRPLNLKFVQLVSIPGKESFFERAGFRVIPMHQVMELSE